MKLTGNLGFVVLEIQRRVIGEPPVVPTPSGGGLLGWESGMVAGPRGLTRDLPENACRAPSGLPIPGGQGLDEPPDGGVVVASGLAASQAVIADASEESLHQEVREKATESRPDRADDEGIPFLDESEAEEEDQQDETKGHPGEAVHEGLAA